MKDEHLGIRRQAGVNFDPHSCSYTVVHTRLHTYRGMARVQKKMQRQTHRHTLDADKDRARDKDIETDADRYSVLQTQGNTRMPKISPPEFIGGAGMGGKEMGGIKGNALRGKDPLRVYYIDRNENGSVARGLLK